MFVALVIHRDCRIQIKNISLETAKDIYHAGCLKSFRIRERLRQIAQPERRLRADSPRIGGRLPVFRGALPPYLMPTTHQLIRRRNSRVVLKRSYSPSRSCTQPSTDSSLMDAPLRILPKDRQTCTHVRNTRLTIKGDVDVGILLDHPEQITNEFESFNNSQMNALNIYINIDDDDDDNNANETRRLTSDEIEQLLNSVALRCPVNESGHCIERTELHACLQRMRWEDFQEWFDLENSEQATHGEVTKDHKDRLEGNVSKEDARHHKASSNNREGKGRHLQIPWRWLWFF